MWAFVRWWRRGFTCHSSHCVCWQVISHRLKLSPTIMWNKTCSIFSALGIWVWNNVKVFAQNLNSAIKCLNSAYVLIIQHMVLKNSLRLWAKGNRFLISFFDVSISAYFKNVWNDSSTAAKLQVGMFSPHAHCSCRPYLSHSESFWISLGGFVVGLSHIESIVKW